MFIFVSSFFFQMKNKLGYSSYGLASPYGLAAHAVAPAYAHAVAPAYAHAALRPALLPRPAVATAVPAGLLGNGHTTFNRIYRYTYI